MAMHFIQTAFAGSSGLQKALNGAFGVPVSKVAVVSC